MADSTSPIDQIVVGQAQPAVIANELFDAMSPAAIFGRRAQTSAGLTWGYYGGRYGGIAIDNGTIVLPASQPNVYIVADRIDGTVSRATTSTNWDDVDNYQRLYLATTGSATVTSYEDWREWINSAETAASVTREQVQDIVGALITAGSNVTVTYDDASSPATIEIASTGGSTLTTEQVQDIVGALLVAGSNATVTYDDASSPASITIASTASVSTEGVQDIVGALIVAGTGIDVTYDDASSPATITIETDGTAGVNVEQVQDVVGAMIVGGTGITATYDDASSPATLTIDATGGLTTEGVQDIVGALLVAGTNATVTYDDASSPATVTIAGPTDEHIQDVVGALVVAGTGITATYNDGANTLTIAATSSGLSTEDVQDIAGALIVGGDGITVTYDDASSPATLTIDVDSADVGCCYSEGSGVPADSPEPSNGWQHFDTDTGIKYTWSSYAGAWVEMGG